MCPNYPHLKQQILLISRLPLPSTLAAPNSIGCGPAAGWLTVVVGTAIMVGIWEAASGAGAIHQSPKRAYWLPPTF